MKEIVTTYALTAGEVSPSFYGRQDLSKYGIGAAELTNCLVDPRGGVVNRPGLEFLHHFPLSEEGHIRFTSFRTLGDDFLILFVRDRMFVLYQGGVLTSGQATVGDGTANVSLPAGWENETYVWVAGDGPEAGLRKVATLSPGQSNLLSREGVPLSIPAGTVIRRLVSLATPFAPFLSGLSFAQDKDNLVVTANGMAPRKINYSSGAWTLLPYQFGFDPALRAGITGTAQSSTTGTAAVGFCVAAVVGGQEQEASVPVTILNMVDYSTEKGWVTINWNSVPNAQRYNVYRTVIHLSGSVPSGTQYGYVGNTRGTSFTDNNIIPDFTKGPLVTASPYLGAGNDPALYTRFQQRGVFAASTTFPSTVWGSSLNTSSVFAISSPLSASDAYTHTIDTNSPEPIRHVLPLRNSLLLFLRDQIVLLRGAEGRALSAVDVMVEPQAYIPTSTVRPILNGLDVLFVQENFSAVHAMLYTEYTNSFQLQDVSILASHLFREELPILAAAWTKGVFKTVYFLRGDGVCLCLTYDREQEVFAWSTLQTDGRFMDLVVLREGTRQVPYFLVERQGPAGGYLSLEREALWEANSIEEAFFVDYGLRSLYQTYPQRVALTGTAHGVQGTLPGAVGDYLYVDGRRFRKDTATTATLLSGKPFALGAKHYYPPGAMTYSTPGTEFGGLWYLEGRKISVLADGSAYLDLLVENGKIVLPSPAGKVVAGIPYRSRIRTLPISSTSTNIEGLIRRVMDVAVRVNHSRGLALGATFEKMEELRERDVAVYAWGQTPHPQSGVREQWLSRKMELDQSLCFGQRYPLPFNLLTYSVKLEVGER